MKKNKAPMAFCICLLICTSTYAQKSGPVVVIKKEFCPPAEYANNGEEIQADMQSVVNEKLLNKVITTFGYNKVLKKLNSDYTITKWKIKSTHTPNQTDTLIIITYARQSDRLVYYKLNKSAGKNLQTPSLIYATIGRDQLLPSPFKFGMNVLEVEKLLNNSADMRDNSTIYITDEPGNSFISLFFIESNGKLILTNFSCSVYWD